ncbi:LysR family transcriptional regulator [Vibrio sp. ZSDZ34]|uniref:LysR family transcriptional regulator n=1 Tax=Vibrio gelatinilyticus TaxID=2893468 RepID=A0A9X2AYK4_9VIBR|nr:LysR family transcriptional regulator [Vibrio gelatinilyticus]MCJ2376782.1 LysR family transcriptional regulator [Vibrio gelatinilyticus]
MNQDINLADVRAFVFVANLGSFTKAAQALNVSRSHVSRQIQSLEKSMKVSLIVRSTRTMKLTETGRRFLSACDGALYSIDLAVTKAVNEVEAVQGNIKVNCVGGVIGEELIAGKLVQFLQQHPDVTIELDFSSHRVDLLEDDFDLAIRMGSLPDASYVARHLRDVDMATLASNDYLMNNPKINHPRDLLNHRCLTGSVSKWKFKRSKSDEEYEVSILGGLKCKNGRVLVEGAKKGIGIIRVPTMYCVKELESGTLCSVMSNWHVPSVPLSVIYHKDRYQPRRLRECIEFLVNSMRV